MNDTRPLMNSSGGALGFLRNLRALRGEELRGLKTHIVIDFQDDQYAENLLAEVIDLYGRVRLNTDLLPSKAQHFRLDISRLSPGIYILCVRSNKFMGTSRFIVQ